MLAALYLGKAYHHLETSGPMAALRWGTMPGTTIHGGDGLLNRRTMQWLIDEVVVPKLPGALVTDLLQLGSLINLL